MARESNDLLADAVPPAPDALRRACRLRAAGPAAAAQGNRKRRAYARTQGVIINSHTHGEYLAIEKVLGHPGGGRSARRADLPAPDVPVAALLEPFLARGLDGAIYGFGCETGLHCSGSSVSGAFDRCSETAVHHRASGRSAALRLFRLDYMHRRASRPSAMPACRRSGKSRATTCAKTSM